MDPAAPSARRPTARQSRAEDEITYGAVHLSVSNLERSLAFWRDAVGLELLERDTRCASLGAGGARLIVLWPGAARARERSCTDIYHVALHVPSERAFVATLRRLDAADVVHAPTDHVSHWATYAEDPDGIDLEVAFETLDRFAGYAPGHMPPAARTTDGRLLPATGMLDVEAIAAQVGDLPRDELERIDPGTRVGHVHMYVNDLRRAHAFYTDVLGFTPHVHLTDVAMMDFSAGGTFPHRLAANAWRGPDAPPRPADTAGLRYVELYHRSAAQRDQLAARADASDIVRDTAGNAFRILHVDPDRADAPLD